MTAGYRLNLAAELNLPNTRAHATMRSSLPSAA